LFAVYLMDTLQEEFYSKPETEVWIAFDCREPGAKNHLHRARRAWGASATVENLGYGVAVLVVRPGGTREIATLEDYACVWELVADLVSDGIEATVPATVREAVEALKQLYADEDESVKIAKVAQELELELDKSAAWRRVRAAIDRGYIKNLEDRKGRPARLVAADALPDDIEILPAPERLQGRAVTSGSEGIKLNNLSRPNDTAREKPSLTSP
jgi:hypothetical protein